MTHQHSKDSIKAAVRAAADVLSYQYVTPTTRDFIERLSIMGFPDITIGDVMAAMSEILAEATTP